MSDANGGAATTALAGGVDNSAGATGAASTTTTTTTAAGATGTTAANDGTWTKDWAAADAGIVEKKGWKSPQDLFKSYRELEKTLGTDRISLPKDANDTEALNAIYTKLGRPESAEKYKFPDGADAEQIKAIAPELHKLGISQTQAEGLAKIDMGRMQQAMEQQQHAWTDDQQKAMDKLNGEWGGKSNEEIEYNRRAMRALGISVEEANVFMRGGSEKFLRLLNLAGRSMREDNTGAMQDDSVLGFGMTGNRAAAEIAEKKTDTAFMQRLQKGDKVATETWRRLHRVAAGERG